jgi:glycosyltransferase involved in cell wall biosynthesis
MKQAVLYICYYNITEPLVRTQVVAYLRELAASGFQIHLLTFELNGLTRDKRRRIRDELAGVGIEWHYLRYHKRPSLAATLYDILAGTLVAMRICKRHGVRLVHARSYVPAAMALMLKRLLGCLVLFDVRGLLPDEYRDAGQWSTDDVKYKLTKRMERVFFRRADAFVVLTNRIKAELTRTGSLLENRGHEAQVIPCCVDTDQFDVSPDERASCRRERGWTNRKVLTYLGKLGTWYLAEEMAQFFAVAREVIPDVFFQVFTQSDHEPIERALRAHNIPTRDYNISFVPPEQVPLVLSASDAGISFIRRCYSKLSSSPTKVGEYLAAGLPVVANSGIGDCDEILTGNRLGVVLRDFSDAEYRRAAEELRTVIEDRSAHARCREFAGRELSLAKVGGPRYVALYQRLLNCETPCAAASRRVDAQPVARFRSDV